MMKDSIGTKSSAIEVHTRLVKLISEESEILEKTTCNKKKKRHEEILEFLVELQCISARSLYHESLESQSLYR